ncbi:aminoglycoside phosphotransferase family protein [Gimesia maris]|uniref:Phosphotransferase enzyme family protein n=1 Tax=Gimesia maris TaxID=122 RepID=A0ABX5YTV5_9PLAN|nr:aminoglycoside phosphotransferase family protein [Gimesia maris]EDL56174.1 putative phosphotransferase [Gimesia maris DSM 8797]QEG19105.1 Phosphotransferase enzyme family protein [Gimesia maris]
MNQPRAEIQIGIQTVQRLLSKQYPALADLPITLVDEGWDNVTFLLGTEYAVRLPRRELAVPLLLHEQQWLPELAARLPLEVPLPIHLGQPDSNFPWSWSIVRWIPGTTADAHDFSAADVRFLATTLQALHQPASSDAPENPFRGIPLHTRHQGVTERLARQRNHPEVDAPRLAALWEELCSTPASTDRVWLHGDLHPRNIIIRDGTLIGIIDWGDLNGGDAATDLACAWLLLDTAGKRQEFFTLYNAEPAQIRRAQGWALHIGLTLHDSNEPRHVPLGLTTLQRVLEDA